MNNLSNESWVPVTWDPVVHPGAPWRFAARLQGATPGEFIGGELYVNGVAFPIEIDNYRVTFTVPAEDVDRIPHRAPCSLYIDHAVYGRFLWLIGSVTRGGDYRDNI